MVLVWRGMIDYQLVGWWIGLIPVLTQIVREVPYMRPNAQNWPFVANRRKSTVFASRRKLANQIKTMLIRQPAWDDDDSIVLDDTLLPVGLDTAWHLVLKGWNVTIKYGKRSEIFRLCPSLLQDNIFEDFRDLYK